MSEIERWKQLFDVISSTKFLKLEDVNPSLSLDNLEYQEISGVEFCSCNKAILFCYIKILICILFK